MAEESYYIGIDVGTASVRVGIIKKPTSSDVEAIVQSVTKPIHIYTPKDEYHEQSSENIWQSLCDATKEAIHKAGLRPQQIKGIGFDATCSLVVLDRQDQPISISPTNESSHNIIMWMDHRALSQTTRINDTHHDVLKYVGNKISLEMQTPKLLWIKENLPAVWQNAGKFFDLADYLTYRATGQDQRSLCTVVCKWTYLGHNNNGWNDDYFTKIGLGDLVEEKYERIGGTKVFPMGTPIGNGLVESSAKEMGLLPGTPVGIGIIDAHAGGLGLLGMSLTGETVVPEVLESRLALISGTSTCHMAVSRNPLFVPGIWGPYYSAMIPGMWLTEGGQSATGSLIDHVIYSHSCSEELKKQVAETGNTVYEILNEKIDDMARDLAFPAILTREFHVLPYFYGNRSPRADPTLRGLISGLKLDSTVTHLALLYYATIQAIAYGTKHIIEEMNKQGYSIDKLFITGGSSKNRIFVREHADITGCKVVLSKDKEAVLLGSAVLGAVASGDYKSVLEAMQVFNRAEKIVEPSSGQVAEYHTDKYSVFHKMYEDQMMYKNTMMKWNKN